MRLQTLNPKGLAPSIDATVLADNMAQIAINCVPVPGRMRPLKAPTFVEAPSKAGAVSIFLNQGTWLNWITPVSVCRSPVVNDQHGRIYFAGGDEFAPQYATAAMANAGIDWPGSSWDLGVPTPTVEPTLVVTGTITDDDPTKVETRYYLFTYVSAYGEEGPNGPVSLSVDVAPGQSVTVSNIPAVPSGNYNITHLRLYRTSTGSEDTDYQLVYPSAYSSGLIPLTASSIDDDCATASLGSVLATATYDMPPDDLHSMIELPNGSFAGLSGNTLCLSEPYQPHAWPVGYRVAITHTPLAHGAYGNYVLIATDGPAYLVSVPTPEAMSNPEKAEEGYACVAARGMVDMGYSLIYPAVDGLRMAGMTEMKLLTKDLIDPEDWKTMEPETIHAYNWNGRYVAFWDNTVTGTEGFIFDPATGDLTYHQVAATGGFTNQATGDLYVITTTGIELWDAGSALAQQWKGKKFFLPDVTGFTCGRVLAESYPLTFSFWSGGNLKKERTVSSSDPFKLPGGFKSKDCEYQVAGSVPWSLIAIATSEKELVSER